MGNSLRKSFKESLLSKTPEDYESIIDDCDFHITINPNNADAYYNRAMACSAMGDNQLAIRDCQKAAELYGEQDMFDGVEKALAMMTSLKESIITSKKVIFRDDENEDGVRSRHSTVKSIHKSYV